MTIEVLTQLKKNKETQIAFLIFLVAAYLSLVNLSYVPLWHDEAAIAYTARSLYLTGGMNGFDGRNLYVFENGAVLNSDLKLVVFPPWQAIPSLLGLWIFGPGETGVRFFHSLLGVLSLILFWQILNLDFSKRARLKIFAFALFALSTQILLFFRQGRYCADAIFFSLLLYYYYRLYISTRGKDWHLGVVTIACVLNFLNHYAIGASFAIAILGRHLLYSWSTTTARQWWSFLLAGTVVTTVCMAYLLSANIFGENIEFIEEEYKFSLLHRKTILIYYNFRDLILLFGWLPLIVCLWLLYYFRLPLVEKIKNQGRKKKKNKTASPEKEEQAKVLEYLFIVVLFTLLSALFAFRKVEGHNVADSRYLVSILPFVAVLNAIFIDWIWRQNKWSKWPALFLLGAWLLSNVSLYPFYKKHLFTHEYFRWTFFPLVGEVHRPYAGVIDELVNYLKENAHQDETISVEGAANETLLLSYLSDQLIFCCSLNEKSTLPKDKVRALKVPIYIGDTLPDWTVVFYKKNKAKGFPGYEKVFETKSMIYPSQRPELEYHTFQAILAPEGRGAVIFRRKDKAEQ